MNLRKMFLIGLDALKYKFEYVCVTFTNEDGYVIVNPDAERFTFQTNEELCEWVQNKYDELQKDMNDKNYTYDY